ncbi:hypothetical protein Peur_060310 [Populus x canadensis]
MGHTVHFLDEGYPIESDSCISCPCCLQIHRRSVGDLLYETFTLSLLLGTQHNLMINKKTSRRDRLIDSCLHLLCCMEYT